MERTLLEASLQSFIDRILEVQNSHEESTEEADLLSRNWEFIFSDWYGWVVLHCSTIGQPGGYWIYPMLCPEGKIDSLKSQLPHYNIIQTSVGYDHTVSRDEHWIKPCWGEHEDVMKSELPLFFSRQYYGHPRGKENYFEFNQIVTHPLGLHWSPTKNSYCRTDEQGEEVERIKIIEHESVRAILIRRRTLDKLLYLGHWVLVRYFVFSRFRTSYPSFEGSTSRLSEPTEYEAKFEIRQCGGDYIDFTGAQIERPVTPREQLLSRDMSDEEEEEEKKYAPFIVWDWKNNTILKDYPLDPRNFSGYFTKSDLPFGTSPIFFKAEVLDKYKGNPDKYELTERTIACRGGWYLETYDINDHNQVHTYAVYLARLPYREQLHWLQYNEEPKGGISKRAFRTDFEAKFPDEKSQLEQLRESLERLGNVRVGDEGLIVWSPKGGTWDAATKGLYCVNSENPNQWHDFIIALANTTIEGFQVQSLRAIAFSLGHHGEKLESLGLIRLILESSNNKEHIPTTHGVLAELRRRRGKGKAHGTWSTPEGSLIEDAAKRLQAVILAIEKLTEVLRSLEIPRREA